MKQKKILLNIMLYLLFSGALSAQVVDDFQVNENEGRCQKYNPSIAVESNGNFIIAWADQRNGNSNIFYQRYDSDGSVLSGNNMVSDFPAGSYQYNPSIAGDASGNFIITWYHEDVITGDHKIYCQRYSTDGTALGGNVQVDIGGMNPSIAMDDSGNFIIVWEEWGNGSNNIYCQRYGSDGVALGNNFRVNDDAGSSTQRNPSIGVDSIGNFMVVWYDNRDGNYDIYCQRYSSDGTSLGSNFKVNDNSGSNYYLYDLSIGVDNSGNFVIVWEDYRNGNCDIYCQRYSSDGMKLGNNFMVNDDAGSSNQYRPSITVDNSGNFIIVWADERNGNYDIYCQRYSTDGTAIGVNFRVNDDSGSSRQDEPCIAVDGRYQWELCHCLGRLP